MQAHRQLCYNDNIEMAVLEAPCKFFVNIYFTRYKKCPKNQKPQTDFSDEKLAKFEQF